MSDECPECALKDEEIARLSGLVESMKRAYERGDEPTESERAAFYARFGRDE